MAHEAPDADAGVDTTEIPTDHHRECPDDQWRYDPDCGCMLCQWWEREVGGVDDELEWWQHVNMLDTDDKE